ncbi:MAG TPA: ion transporter [Oligoflexus sp.]|uniref:ion transporter n=1 Tax=Oligoflexus sp. TaxID=1971216 RepID=UPI002D503DE5|nr:ion transporter [Oligoflexus sp.]HYX32676.1 ion transporter [Oligoflexus sp.]
MKSDEPPALPDTSDVPASRASWRKQIYIVIFGSDTPAGKLFDIVLLWLIILSILCVSLESVSGFQQQYGQWLRLAEWIFTILFTTEYILRLISTPKPGRYAKSFLGLIDLCSIIPTYLSFYFAGSQALLVIRAIRLLRVFRILKLVQYTGEASVLLAALKASRHKILVFLGGVLSLILIVGALMYLVEGPENGFTNIPVSVYWAVVTLTTVGYGDITPLTPLGKFMAACVMLMGYGILAVPTGIMSVEIGRASRQPQSPRACPRCAERHHMHNSQYCFRCGERLTIDPPHEAHHV